MSIKPDLTPRSHIQSIQGLRALAVIAVLLFHARVSGMAGGFVGVDVFFVISGFVITRLIRHQLETQSFSFAEFYKRRAWRLMPVLAATLFFTALVFGFLMPASENPSLFLSLISATFGLSNFYFSNTLDYFDSGIANPVLHTWSLGVEEQFYLMFPLLMWFLYGKQSQKASHQTRRLLVCGSLIFIAIAGFIIAAYQTYQDTNSAFFLPWFRAWQFLSGAILAYVALEKVPNPLARLSSWSGIIILIAIICAYDEQTSFPGLGAVLPTAATMLLIYGATNQNSINRILTTKALRFIGNSSYSIYLVHWPIICFVGLFISLQNPITQGLNIGLSLVFGFLFWYFIEEKFRHGIKSFSIRKKALVPIALVFCSTFLVFSAGFVTQQFWEQFPTAKRYFAETTKHLHLFRAEQCFMVKKPADHYDINTCLKLSDKKENILVMGDSLAANIVMELQKKWPDKNFMQATAQEYIPGNYDKWLPLGKSLDQVVDTFYQNHYQKINTFILYALWQQDDIPALQARIRALKAAGHQVIVLGPSPQLYVSAPMILAHSEIFDYDFSKFLFKTKRHKLDQLYKDQLKDANQYVSTYDILCKSGNCDLTVKGKPLYFDDIHYTQNGAEYLVSQIKGWGSGSSNMSVKGAGLSLR